MVTRRGLGGNVEDQTDGVTDLGDHRRADVAAYLFDASYRYRSHVLALRGRESLESVGLVRFHCDLRGKRTDGGGEGHHLDDGWLCIEDALCSNDYGGMAEAGLSAFGKSKV